MKLASLHSIRRMMVMMVMDKIQLLREAASHQKAARERKDTLESDGILLFFHFLGAKSCLYDVQEHEGSMWKG